MSGNDWNIIQLKKGKEKNLRKVQFVEDIKKKDDATINKESGNIIEKALNTKLAAHIDIGKMIDTLNGDNEQ